MDKNFDQFIPQKKINLYETKRKILFLQHENKTKKMKKEYHKKQKEPLKVEEPRSSYGVKNNSESSSLQSSKKARIIENTMSVDEFFDDLISLVRSDYESI